MLEDAGVAVLVTQESLASALKQALVCDVLNKRVLERVACIRYRPASEDELCIDQPIERNFQVWLGPTRNLSDQIV